MKPLFFARFRSHQSPTSALFSCPRFVLGSKLAGVSGYFPLAGERPFSNFPTDGRRETKKAKRTLKTRVLTATQNSILIGFSLPKNEGFVLHSRQSATIITHNNSNTTLLQCLPHCRRYFHYSAAGWRTTLNPLVCWFVSTLKKRAPTRAAVRFSGFCWPSYLCHLSLMSMNTRGRINRYQLD